MSKPVRGMGVSLDLLNKDFTRVPIDIFGTEHILDDTAYDTANEADLAAYFDALKNLGVEDPEAEVRAAIAEGEGPWTWSDSGDRYIEDVDRLNNILTRKLRKGFHSNSPQFPNINSFKEGIRYYLDDTIGWRNADTAKINDDGTVEVELPDASGKPFTWKYQANIKPADEYATIDYDTAASAQKDGKTVEWYSDRDGTWNKCDPNSSELVMARDINAPLRILKSELDGVSKNNSVSNIANTINKMDNPFEEE